MTADLPAPCHAPFFPVIQHAIMPAVMITLQALNSQLLLLLLQVENPIPFADSFLARALSTGHLHARYFGLLLVPARLSADWSFACVPLVQSLGDSRNPATAALYCLAAWVAWTTSRLVAARVSAVMYGGGGGGRGSSSEAVVAVETSTSAGAKRLAQESTAANHSASAGQLPGSGAEARWACFVFCGLLAAPFLPSSNLLFYVGTYIGERLQYIPSIGFCLLLARLLVALEGAQVQSVNVFVARTSIAVAHSPTFVLQHDSRCTNVERDMIERDRKQQALTSCSFGRRWPGSGVLGEWQAAQCRAAPCCSRCVRRAAGGVRRQDIRQELRLGERGYALPGCP